MCRSFGRSPQIWGHRGSARYWPLRARSRTLRMWSAVTPSNAPGKRQGTTMPIVAVGQDDRPVLEPERAFLRCGVIGLAVVDAEIGSRVVDLGLLGRHDKVDVACYKFARECGHSLD